MNNKKASIPKKFLIPYIILSITIVILAVNFILKYADIATPYTYPPSTLLNALDYHEYGRAYEYSVRNQADGVDGAEYKEVYAASDYWHSASCYYADPSGRYADVYLKNMETDRENAGSLQYIIDEIDDMLAPYK